MTPPEQLDKLYAAMTLLTDLTAEFRLETERTKATMSTNPDDDMECMLKDLSLGYPAENKEFDSDECPESPTMQMIQKLASEEKEEWRAVLSTLAQCVETENAIHNAQHARQYLRGGHIMNGCAMFIGEISGAHRQELRAFADHQKLALHLLSRLIVQALPAESNELKILTEVLERAMKECDYYTSPPFGPDEAGADDATGENDTTSADDTISGAEEEDAEDDD
ncbi:hypothetical protein BCR34DRAFT_598876 [Clohesyomyces aquaticus]|uniref:Uncharacterized protein n=1 Tax=Clohesyomyces aquaticus TaxID=1231657 RepID=A0A1Y1ZWW2_9PLEO|nr:hypothetical protein BCR34DRAFT_598876 [Clohesyomyces aquaticus]